MTQKVPEKISENLITFCFLIKKCILGTNEANIFWNIIWNKPKNGMTSAVQSHTSYAARAANSAQYNNSPACPVSLLCSPWLCFHIIGWDFRSSTLFGNKKKSRGIGVSHPSFWYLTNGAQLLFSSAVLFWFQLIFLCIFSVVCTAFCHLHGITWTVLTFPSIVDRQDQGFCSTPKLAATQQQQPLYIHQQERASAAAAPTGRMRRVQQLMPHVSFNVSFPPLALPTLSDCPLSTCFTNLVYTEEPQWRLGLTQHQRNNTSIAFERDRTKVTVDDTTVIVTYEIQDATWEIFSSLEIDGNRK